MSTVKVYPYISETLDDLLQTPTAMPDASASQQQAAGFQEVLADASSRQQAADVREIFAGASRMQQAMAVDALIAASDTGGVDLQTIQQLFGFHPGGKEITPAAGQDTTGAASASASGSASASASGAASASVSGVTSAASSGSDALGCPAELDAYFTEAAEKYHVDVKLLKAIAKTESNFNTKDTSSAGAMGVMQLMPATARSLGIEDPYDPYANILGGAKVIAQHLEKYNGDLSLALAAYNAGSGNVDKYGGIPPFQETQNYVKKVLDFYENA